MSFQEPRSAISIVNRALSKIGQQGLSGDLDDVANGAKHSGREARLHYKPTVRRLLEQHHWNLATKRVALVQTTNARSLEWTLAYAKPSDMAFAVGIGNYAGTAGAISYYRGVGSVLAKLYGRPLFLSTRDAIYSYIDGAELEYVSFDITEADFSQELEDMVVDFLAAKFAYSVAKDVKMGDGFQREALNNLNAVIAHNLNTLGQRYDTLPSESELARDGIDPWMAGYMPVGSY